MKEEWRDIKGYEGLYQVSNLGRVKSLNYKNTGKEEILSNIPRKDGYSIAGLSKNSKSKPFYVHRLVALHFIPNPNNLPQVNHKDENKENNKVSNLEWCTQSYNNCYGTRIKRASESSKGKNKGSKNGRARKILCVTTREEFNCIQEAAEHYSINKCHITNCCQGKVKSAGKHPDTGEKLIWKYID